MGPKKPEGWDQFTRPLVAATSVDWARQDRFNLMAAYSASKRLPNGSSEAVWRLMGDYVRRLNAARTMRDTVMTDQEHETLLAVALDTAAGGEARRVQQALADAFRRQRTTYTPRVARTRRADA
jgi:hypothetical protein